MARHPWCHHTALGDLKKKRKKKEKKRKEKEEVIIITLTPDLNYFCYL